MSKRAEEAALKAYPIIPLPQYDLRDENPTDGNKIHRRIFLEGYEQAEKTTIERIREQVKRWMPEKNGEEHTCGEMVAFNSVLHLLEEMEEE